MFATPDQIIEAVNRRFNARTSDMGFGLRAQAHLPVKVSDLKEPTGLGGESGRPVSMCRHLCMYVIAQHCVQFNPYQRTHKQISFSAIGTYLNKTPSAVEYSIKRACAMLADPVHAQVYQGSLDDINEQGLELWRAKFSRVQCGR